MAVVVAVALVVAMGLAVWLTVRVMRRRHQNHVGHLTQAHARQLSEARAQASAHERERIYQDLHDGVGARLLTLVLGLRGRPMAPEGVQARVQSCLNELRRVVHHPLHDGADIQSVVFEYCLDIESHMLGDAPCLRYEVSDGPAIHLLAPVQVHVFRFLQEAVANAIQHAQAKVIWVRLSQTETTLTLVIEDDGKGLPADVGAWMLASPDGLELAQAHGRLGLRGLLARARAMGGVCSLTAAEPGTRVALCLPLIRGGDGGSLPLRSQE